MPNYYPLYLDLTDKRVLVVGGGTIGERKVYGLLEAGARVRLVCLEATPQLVALQESGAIELLRTPYHPDQLADIRLVIVATNDPEVNHRIGVDAAARNVWVNRADSYQAGDCVVPAVIRRGDLCISVSTGGRQPLLTARLTEELERRFGTEFGLFVELLGRMRTLIKACTDDPDQRRNVMKRLLDAESELRPHLIDGDLSTAMQVAEGLVKRALDAETTGSDRVNAD